MTTAQLYHYALQGVNEELNWLWGVLSPHEIRQQHKLLRLRQRVRRWQIKYRLRQLGKWNSHYICNITAMRIVRSICATSARRAFHFQHAITYLRNNPSKPLPLP